MKYPLPSDAQKPVYCRCCGHSELKFRNGKSGSSPYCKCIRCGSFQLHPRPTDAELEIFYNTSYRVSPARHFRQMARIGGHLLALLEKRVKGRRLLEIGCSYGGFLRLAHSRGWSCVGVEVSEDSAAKARDLGFEVHTGSLDTNAERLNGRAFDLVIGWHVIEHLLDCHTAIRLATELLSPGGYLAIRTPNACSLGARVLGDYWEWFHSPEHVHIFSPIALRQLVSESGLTVEQLLSWRGDAGTLLTQVLAAASSRVLRRFQSVSREARLPNQATPRGFSRLRAKLSTMTDFLGRPIDYVLGLNGSTLQGSELFLLARRSIPDLYSQVR